MNVERRFERCPTKSDPRWRLGVSFLAIAAAIGSAAPNARSTDQATEATEPTATTIVYVHPSLGDSDRELVFLRGESGFATAGSRVIGGEPTYYDLEVTREEGATHVFFETTFRNDTSTSDTWFRDGGCFADGDDAPWVRYPIESIPFPYDFRLACSFLSPGQELTRRAARGELEPGLLFTGINGIARSTVALELTRFSSVQWQDQTHWRFTLLSTDESAVHLLCRPDGAPIRVVQEAVGLNATLADHHDAPLAAVHSTEVDEGPWRAALSKKRYKTHARRGQMIPMKDGVRLAADVVLPNTSVPVPTILIRTPYLRAGELITAEDKYPPRGYALVVQDVRGRGDSEGVFDPFLHEASDASDTLDWIAAQPWSDGGVGMIGSSYVGVVQWYAAISGNPHLKAIIPIVSPPDPDENFPYEGGVLMLMIGWWAAVMDAQDEDGFAAGIPLLDYAEAFRALPLSELDSAVETKRTFVDDWVAHPPSDHEYWAPRRFHPRIPEIDIPVLNISGWFDGDQPGALLNFQAMRDRGPVSARDHQYLMMGPWGHGVNLVRRLGDVDFGDKAVIDLDAVCLRFFDRYMKGISNGIDEEDRVLLFTMGENRWRRTTNWPPPEVHPTRVFLRGEGNAGLRTGDGRLSLDPPDDSSTPPDTYRYDPLDPIDLGPMELDFSDILGNSATADHSQIVDRVDVLDFRSPPLAEDVTLTGNFTYHLTVSTDAADTDFAGGLFSVDEAGRMLAVSGGIQRLRYRKGPAVDEPVAPNTVVPIVIDGWANSIRIKAGQRLHLQLSSTAFPAMARNLNTLEPATTATRAVIANNSIYHDALRLSWIELPVAEGTTLRFE